MKRGHQTDRQTQKLCAYVNDEEEIDKLKWEIWQLQESNKEVINLLTEFEELKIENEYLKHTAENLDQSKWIKNSELRTETEDDC